MFDTPGDDPDEKETRRRFSNTPETPIERERRERAERLERLASTSPSNLNYDELYNEILKHPELGYRCAGIYTYKKTKKN